MENDNDTTYFAESNYRNTHQRFGIKKEDRTKHIYVIGKTGMGKSNMLENMAVQDIQNGEGIGFIDPHGGTAELLLDHVPESRIDDVIYFDPSDAEFPISFNILEDVGYDKRHLVVSGLMNTFEKIWVDAWSARMSYILGNTLLALLEYPDATLMSVNRMLADKNYRKKVVDNVTDPAVRSFWVDEFAKYSDRYAQEATPAIQNKIGQFTANPLIRNIIGQSKTSLNIREIMDKKKIFIINLSKGKMGEQNASLLGAILITKIYLSAMSRAEAPADELKKMSSFFFFVDEFQSFASKSFADILSEARKYKLSLTIAHQYIEQMSDEVRAAVFGNVGTMISFRVGAYDAEILEKEFAPEFLAEDLVNIGQYQMYLKLMIDGVGSRPFSANALAPVSLPPISFKEKIIEASRRQYAQPRAEVEKSIKNWHEEGSVKDNSKDVIVTNPKTSATSPTGEAGGGKGKKDEYIEVDKPELFEAVCEVCEKKTMVPFKPVEGRPIYCKTHRKNDKKTKSTTTTTKPTLGKSEPAKKTISLTSLKSKEVSTPKKDIKNEDKASPNLQELRDLLKDTYQEEKKV